MKPQEYRQYVKQVILLVALEFVMLALVLWSMIVKF